MNGMIIVVAAAVAVSRVFAFVLVYLASRGGMR